LLSRLLVNVGTKVGEHGLRMPLLLFKITLKTSTMSGYLINTIANTAWF
jgi:hypothetical protein